ncbi:hypothetical protein CK231_10540 [Mesorhizobium loti]|nr:hypothetical protein CK231_10540 [Mesorhizobium loti]
MEDALISDKRHGFPVESIVHTVWGYYLIPFPFSVRLGEEMLLEGGMPHPTSRMRARPVIPASISTGSAATPMQP